MKNSIITRRRFLRESTIACGTSLFMIPHLASLAGQEPITEENSLVRFGVMADVHKDIMHEGRITGELSRADATQEKIMHLATGGE